MSRLGIAASVLLLACAPVDPPQTLVPVPAVKESPLLGCWSLSSSGIDPLFLAPPGGVRLADSAAASSDGSIDDLVLRVGAGIRHGRLPPHSSWTLVARDSARLSWGDGFVGFTATLAVHGDSLVGRGHTHTDVRGAAPPTSRIVGRRVSCGDVGL